jgi:ABC-2 type transport system permease protein
MLRYLRLLGVQVRASLLIGIQYRSDFWLDAVISVFYTVASVLPLVIVFQNRQQLGGWSFGEALLVSGWFTLLEGVLQGAINPSLINVVEAIRKGTLDFVLLKPADAQFLVSTSRFEPWRASNFISAGVIFAIGFSKIGHGPSWIGVLGGTVLLLTSVVLLYSLWILTVSLAFYVVKVDNLTYLFESVFDAARWPVSVFPRGVRIVFTYVLPLAVMTSFPAWALLGQLSLNRFAGAVVGAAVFALLARRMWLMSLSRYTSASS